MKSLVLVSVLGLSLSACSYKKNLKEEVTKILKEDPSILQEVIEENPTEFISSFQKALKDAQTQIAKQRKEDEAFQLENNFKNPLQAKIRKDELIIGKTNAPLTLIEYTDFECPFCKRGKETIVKLKEKYGDKIKIIYKHMPLSFHKNAKIASQYYEAIRIQDDSKAISFHDKIFESQEKLRLGESFLIKLAKEVGADIEKVKRDLNSKEVIARIKEDESEAQKFGFQGTPGFLLNGIPVRGAYPAEHFVKIVEELKKRKLVKI